jgi:hypothetical protein
MSHNADHKKRIRVQFIADALSEIEGSEQRLMDVRKEGSQSGLCPSSLMQCSQWLDSRLLKVRGVVYSFAYVCSPRTNIVIDVFGWFILVLCVPRLTFQD